MSEHARTPRHVDQGVEIAGVGSAVPERVLTNQDLEKLMDTSDEWIVQRTGIHSRHIADLDREGTTDLAAAAAERALEDAGLTGADVDFVVVATMTPDMPTPAVSSLVAHRIGTNNVGSFDLGAACCGFVFALNTLQQMLVGGMCETGLLIGADCITRHVKYNTYSRGASILFGDAAGAVVLRRTNDCSKGLIAWAMHTDGGRSRHLLIPCHKRHFEDQSEYDERKLNMVHMNGQAVFKFAVKTFPDLIVETLDKAGMTADDVDHFVCHQSNTRILKASSDRFGLPPEKLHVNIDRYGNTVAASVPLVLDDLKRSGRLQEGQRVMFLGFGAGLTWGSSLWQI